MTDHLHIQCAMSIEESTVAVNGSACKPVDLASLQAAGEITSRPEVNGHHWTDPLTLEQQRREQKPTLSSDPVNTWHCGAEVMKMVVSGLCRGNFAPSCWVPPESPVCCVCITLSVICCIVRPNEEISKAVSAALASGLLNMARKSLMSAKTIALNLSFGCSEE